MKRIILGVMLAMLYCALVQGGNRTVTENDSHGNKKRVIELKDTVINGQTVTDTLSIMTYETDADSNRSGSRKHHRNDSGLEWGSFSFGDKASETLITVTAIVFVFGLPLLILSLIHI